MAQRAGRPGEESAAGGGARYLRHYAALTGLALLATAALNVVADVYGYFGTPRWSRVDLAYRGADEWNSDRAVLVYQRRAAVRADGHPVVLVGTSATMHGFDTRELPAAFNAGLSSTSLEEGTEIAAAAFDRPRPARLVLLEASPPGRASAPAPPDLYDWLLAFGTTRASAHAVLASAFGALRDRPPGPRDFFSPEPAASPRAWERSLSMAVAAFRASLAASAERSERTRPALRRLLAACDAAGGTVVLFLPPRHPRVLAAPELTGLHAAWVATLRAELATAPAAPRCRLRLVDVSWDDGAWGAPRGRPAWTAADFTTATHFRPRLGARVYARLLAAATDR